MSTGKRLAKRSIVGTRVSVPGQDGRYHPAVIRAMEAGSVYRVLLDDSISRDVAEKDIVGPGFQSMAGLKLVAGQPVFITHQGREVGAVVRAHRTRDEVVVVVGGSGRETLITKKLDDVRLVESRKSARLLDLDQDYSRLADGAWEASRKRTTSSGIDVPTHGNRKRRPSASSDVDVLDDCAAAMVLMSLSCSPKSPRLPTYINEAGVGGFFSRSWTETSLASSSGASSWQSNQSQRSSNSTPSPPHGLLGESASIPLLATSSSSSSTITAATVQGIPAVPADEGVELDDAFTFLEDPLPRKRRNSTKTAFQCTWPGCKMVTVTCDAIEKHVRLVHLGRMHAEEIDHSDHEEEFYYTEMEVATENVTDTFSNMHTSSPPTLSHMDMARPPYEDPEYQKLLQMSPAKQSKVTGFRVASSSPKPSPLRHRKCRKVYGMENRDLWCTQCKWKKACTRFSDVSLPLI